MDTFLNIIAIFAIAVVIFLAVGFVGFRIPAPLRWPTGEPSAPLTHLSSDILLPPTAKKWFSQDSSDAPTPSSLVAWGRGRIASHMPIVGKIWLPLSWTLYLEPGKNFIIQNRVTWFGRRFIRGGEEYRDGKGTFIMGSKPADNPYLDETEKALLWMYSIWLAPASLINEDAVSLIETDANNLRLMVREDDQTERKFHLEFDTAAGLLLRITGVRKGSQSGEDYPYIASLANPKTFINAGKIPTQYTADWDNDVYIKFELAGIALNQDVSEFMQIGIQEMPSL